MNKTLETIQPSTTLAITSRARALAESGLKVCSFAAGEPDFDTPQRAKDGAIKALLEGRTKYTPIAGVPELCAAIAEKLERENGLKYAPSQILVSCGGKHSLANAFLALCNPGDEVVIPAPYWLSYPEMVKIAGGVPVFAQASEENGLKITPEQLAEAITPRTRAFVLNSPSNPTGVVYTEEEMRALAELCVERGVYIVTDEIYERMVYDGARHVSVAALSREIHDMTLTINGFSKAYAMTGWRIGYTAAPAAVIRAMSTVQSHTASPPTTFAQYGAITALRECESEVCEMVEAFAARRKRIFELISEIPRMGCINQRGAFYMFPNISAFGMGSQEFCERLIEEKHVAAVPGSAFGADDFIRLSYACSMDNIEEGMRRLREFADGL